MKQLTVRDLELRGGLLASAVSGVDYWGGGLRYYCGEGKECTGVLNNVTLIGNQAYEGGGFALYCYVDTTCSATLIDSLVDSNQAVAGGGITTGFDEENFAFQLTLINSAVEGNVAEEGGGIRLRGAGFSAINSRIRFNQATAGGGLAMIAGSYILHADILSSTISENEATERGGGLYIRSADPGDVNLTVVNSTVSSNRVISETGIGGGIAMSATYGLGVDLLNSTVVSNSASSGAGLHFALEDNAFAPPTLVTLGNSMIAGNQPGSDCATVLEQDSGTGIQLITSLGHNLDSDSSCLTAEAIQAGDIANGTASLGALAGNGGGTPTHALLPGSAAIDAGDDAICAAAPVNGVDQRGAARSQGAHCDIGAYELLAVAACTYPELVASDDPSLRQAIECLNVAPAGAYTLTIAAAITYTQPMFTLSNPAITNLLIAGAGHTLDANGQGRVLTLNNVQNLTLRDLTLTGGKLGVDDEFQGGGGLAFDCSDGLDCTWTLLNTVVANNQADRGGGVDYFCSAGGGGALIVQNSTIRDNRASDVGGGLIYHTDEDSGLCSVTLRNTLLEGNHAVAGGAIRISRPRVTIIDSTIRNNVATSVGGGLMARISDGFIDMNILNSTVSGNRAGLSGGGLYIRSPDQTFDIKLVNSTVSSNTVTSGAGGGLYLHESNDSLRISLLNSTVTQNAASQGAGVHVFHQDSSFEMTGTLRLTNSIVAGNMGSDCAGDVAAGVVFTGQQVTSFGHNLDGDGTCLPPAVAQPSDLPSGNANLGPLADNGGPTFTHDLLPGSDAIDAGDDAVCAAEPVNGVDQRGVQRPQGAHCDIGAVELQPADGTVFTVTKFTDSNDGACDADCSLREAIQAANTNPGRGKIVLASGVYSLTIPTLRDEEHDTIDEDDNAIGDLDITDDLLLVGSGAAATIIDGNQVDRVFEVLSPANGTIEDVTIRNGYVSEVGGGLSNSGNLTLNRVHILANLAASGFSTGHGGGLFNEGVLTVSNSLIANNHAGGGEASYGQGGGIRNDGTLTISQSTLRANTVSDDNDYGIGGGIVNQGTVQIDRSTLAENGTVRGPGGAIANRLGGQVEVFNSTISGNSAGIGGGIANGDPFDEPGTVRLIHATLANNRGGGLYNRGVTTSTNTIIAGNATSEDAASQNCHNEGTFISLGATLLDSVGNCPSTGPGDITVDQATVFTSLLGALADNGGPTQIHALLPGSVARDAAQDAVCTASPINGVDQRDVVRPQGSHCDIGAYEAEMSAANLLFVSSSSTAHAGDVSFRDEDILAYDFSTETWLLIFDGSDVGVTKDVDAFSFLAAGDLLLSFNGATTVPGLGTVDDSDIVRFTPTALGSDTSGSFAWYLRGADVGLTTDSEDIDLIDFGLAGNLVVSTIGNFDAPNAAGRDEDLIELTEATFGSPSSGTWRLFFDASSVGLANEDINGLWIDPASGDLYLTVKDSFAFDAQAVDSDDIFICTPTQTNVSTTCAYRLFWDSDGHDYGSENLDAIHLGGLPSSFSAPVQSGGADQTMDEDASADDDVDDLDVDEQNSNRIFLPIIVETLVEE